MSDLDLARRILAGDESASEAFFADYFPRLYRFARRRLEGDEQAVEDVVQSTLIRAVRKLHTYRGEAALFTWLCTLCRKRSADGFSIHAEDRSVVGRGPSRHADRAGGGGQPGRQRRP